jgi:hypothetical protein
VSTAFGLKCSRFEAETPRLLFEGAYVQVGGPSYDVTPDSQRFLLFEPAA